MVGKGVITSRTLEGPNRSLRALYPRRPRIWYTRSIDQRLGFYRGISFEHWAPAPPSPRQKAKKIVFRMRNRGRRSSLERHYHVVTGSAAGGRDSAPGALLRWRSVRRV